jgi:hypothetical protein
MPIIGFPFLQLSPASPSRPILFVKIVYPQTGLMVDMPAIIDTGADCCAVPAILAKDLGLNWRAGIPKLISTGNGPATAYSHICCLEIYDTNLLLNGDTSVIHKIIDVPMDFMEDLPVVLLGTTDFLSPFFLYVDYPSELFSVRSP